MIFIRCDSSTEIGTGHVFRCLALAKQLKQLGHNVEFVCKDLPGNISGTIEANQFGLHLLPSNADDQEFLDRKAQGRSWLIVDHYKLDFAWEKPLAAKYKVFVIDDLFDRKHHCDVLLNQNYQKTQDAYTQLVPQECLKLLGPQYCLLREEFAQPNHQQKEKSTDALVFFGGGDPTNETHRFLDAAKEAELNFTVVVSQSHPQLKSIVQMKLPANITLAVSPTEISKLMLHCRLYFGAGGTMTWERMSMGLPGIVVSIAENQTKIAEDLAADGLQIYLGPKEKIDYRQAIEKIKETLEDKNWLRSTASKNRSLVRAIPKSLLKSIFADPDRLSGLKIADYSEARFLWELRNDPQARKMFVSQEEIPWESHLQWLKKSLSNPNFRIYLGYQQGKPYGQFRVNQDGDTSLSVAQACRGQGLSQVLIQGGSQLYLEEFRTMSTLSAKIKKDNPASRSAFEKAGYRFSKVEGEYDKLVFLREDFQK